jgi:dihydrofolate reductase
MRKLVVSEFMSLDGVVEDPAWTFPYWNDEIARFKGQENEAADALLLGRVTYEGFAQAWPDSPDEGAERMNAMPKHVATRTLDALEWNATPLHGDLAGAVSSLKAADGGDLLVYGSPTLVDALLREGLVDELRLLVYPVVLGAGRRLFRDGTAATQRLLETRPLGPDVTLLSYGPAAR